MRSPRKDLDRLRQSPGRRVIGRTIQYSAERLSKILTIDTPWGYIRFEWAIGRLDDGEKIRAQTKRSPSCRSPGSRRPAGPAATPAPGRRPGSGCAEDGGGRTLLPRCIGPDVSYP